MPNPVRAISDEELVRTLQMLNAKTEYLNQQLMQVGLYMEFVVDHLFAMKDKEGNLLLDIDMTKFPEFAETRFKQMQEDIRKSLEEEKARAEGNINLNE